MFRYSQLLITSGSTDREIPVVINYSSQIWLTPLNFGGLELFALILHSTRPENYLTLTLMPYFDIMRKKHGYKIIFVSYWPIKNLNNVMLLWQLLNARSIIGQLQNLHNCFNRPTVMSGEYWSMVIHGVPTMIYQ